MKERILRHLNFMDEFLADIDNKSLAELKKIMEMG